MCWRAPGKKGRNMKAKAFCITLILVTLGAMVCSFLGLYGAMFPARTSASILLRMAVPYPENHPSARAAAFFSQRVAEESGGEIHIRVYYNGDLGTEESAVEQLELGGIALAVISSLELEEKYVDWEEPAAEEYPGGIFYPSESALQKSGMQLITLYQPDLRCIATRTGELGTDPAGMAIQTETQPVLRRQLTGLGFTPVDPSGSGVESALYLGDIEGAEMSLVEYVTWGYQSIMPHVTLFAGPLAPDVILASRSAMSRLSIEQQNIIRACGKESQEYHQEILRKEQKNAVEGLEKQGIPVQPSIILEHEPEEWITFWPQYYGIKEMQP